MTKKIFSYKIPTIGGYKTIQLKAENRQEASVKLLEEKAYKEYLSRTSEKKVEEKNIIKKSISSKTK